MHNDDETIASLATEIASGLREVTEATRERVKVIMTRHQLQTQARDERWDKLMAEAEEICKKYR